MKDLPNMTLIRGTGGLADALGVSRCTIDKWRKLGYLDGTEIIDTGRIVVFAYERVLERMEPKNLKAYMERHPNRRRNHNREKTG